MKTIETTIHFYSSVDTVYMAMTDNSNDTWRTDLDKIEVIDDSHFIEYDKKGFPTTMTITKKKVNREYAFTLDNKNCKGNWIGKCQALPNGGCELYVKESMMIKPILLRPFSFLMNIKKFQDQYIRDLKTYLKEEV